MPPPSPQPRPAVDSSDSSSGSGSTSQSSTSQSSGSHGDSRGGSSNGAGVSSSLKRKSDEHGGDDGTKKRATSNEGPTSFKRSSDDMINGNMDDGDMADWLNELVRIPGETCNTVVIFETLEGEAQVDDVAEVFSPPRVVTVARRGGLKGSWSFDKLVERSPGVQWDLSDTDHQKACMAILEDAKPGLIVGSPPMQLVFTGYEYELGAHGKGSQATAHNRSTPLTQVRMLCLRMAAPRWARVCP